MSQQSPDQENKTDKEILCPGGILILDDALKVVQVTDYFQHIFNCDKSHLLGQSIEDLFNPKDRKGIIQFHDRLSQFNDGTIDIIITLHINGQDYLSRLRMTRQHNQWAAIVENMLEESGDLFRQFHLAEQRWSSIARNSSEGIAMLDAEGKLVEFNSRFLEMMRFHSSHDVLLNEDAVQNKNFFSLFGHSVTAELEQFFFQAKQKKQRRFKIEFSHHNRALRLEISSILVPIQGFSGCSIVIVDISSQKQLEQLLVDMDAYAHTVAHDLKNPLSVIISNVDFYERCLDCSQPEAVDEQFAIIKKAGQKMVSIIDELLLLARIRRQDEIDLVALDMEQLVKSALQHVSVLSGKYNAQIQLPVHWPMCVGYAPWVEEIWVNYLSNAIKYGGKPPVIEIGIDQNDDCLKYFVRDNGQGLDEQEQTQLFSEYSRLEQHQRVDGSGLGLSIVKRISEKLGGEVGVESAPGQGSLFYFTLPVVE